jgi:streptogramin lyase
LAEVGTPSSGKQTDMAIRKIAVLVVASIVIVSGCSATQPIQQGPFAGRFGSVDPHVLQNGDHGGFVTFVPKTNSPTGTQYKGIVTGPDKNIWVIDQGNHALARIDMAGDAKEFPLPAVSSTLLDSVAVGADGKFYVPTGASPGVVETLTTAGAGATISIPSGDAALSGVTKGPDGNIWFPEYYHIGKITTAGAVTEYPYPNGMYISIGGDVTTGPDGNLWFAFVTFNGSYAGNVMKIVPASGAMTIYSLAGVGCQYDQGIVAGADGNVWVDCGPSLVRVDPSGNATAFTLSDAAGMIVGDMTAGAGALIWYVGAVNSAQLVSFDVNTHAATDHNPPTNSNTPYHVTQGPDKNIWFTGYSKSSPPLPSLGIYILHALTVSPKTATLTVGQMQTLTVTESGVTRWTAKSSAPGIASVAPGESADLFVVTGVAAGTAQITVTDPMRNTYRVNVTVQ